MIDRNKVEQAVRLLLEGMGEDPSREGLIDTLPPALPGGVFCGRKAAADEFCRSHKNFLGNR